MSDLDSQTPPGETGSSARSPQFLMIVAGIAFVCGAIFLTDYFWLMLSALAVLVLIIWYRYSENNEPVARRIASTVNAGTQTGYGEAIVDAMQHPVLIIDQRANLVFANAASKKLFGEFRIAERIFIRFRQPELRRAVESVITTGVPSRVEYHEAVPVNLWFEVEIAPISTGTEIPKAPGRTFIISFQNLTETRRIEQMRSDFIANASHELRTPLASLIGYLETLKGPAKNDQKAIARFTDIMLEQAERMSRLVNDLLSLSKIEMKSHVRPTDVVEVSDILKTVINALDPLAHQMKVTIETDIQGPILIEGDRDELVQVFENLIENACKYGQDGERIVVSAGATGDGKARISIRDFGPGIALEHQHRITERFYRVDVARSREKQGTGLGLAIVKHILQRHGTRLNLDSKPDEGALFWVDLALVENVEKQ